MKVTYHGHEVMTYPQYQDLSTGKTLTCIPGGSYDITPDVMPTDGRLAEAPPEKARGNGVTKVTASDTPSGGKE